MAAAAAAVEAANDDQQVALLEGMGWDRHVCEQALAKFHNNTEVAVEYLLANNGRVSPTVILSGRSSPAAAAAAPPAQKTACPTCTFENEPAATACAMCDQPLAPVNHGLDDLALAR